jgi:uncharacterized repeat protein (TIGR03803 family)
MIGKQLVTVGVLILTVFAALALILATPAQAQTETVLYNFTPGSDGGGPTSIVTPDGKGNFYGTTIGGGEYGYGTVYELSPNGSGGWNESVLYSFPERPNGEGVPYPSGPVILDSKGNLYGTLIMGGDTDGCGWGTGAGCGAVYELSPAGTSWTETVLYNFCSQTGCADGEGPSSGVIMDAAGNLYGVASFVVFELSQSPGGWTEQVIYSPNAFIGGVTMDAAGNLFGGTFDPPPGTVFELSPNGDGGWTPTVVHTFTGYPLDGSEPISTPVFDQAGNLYGTTLFGGAHKYGTVYKLTPAKNEQWTETILSSFASDGRSSSGAVVLDATGNVYGTTSGSNNNGGTVFELVAPVGKGKYKYKKKVLWSFDVTDGLNPLGVTLDSASNLYGTTSEGGSSNGGVVFEITP